MQHFPEPFRTYNQSQLRDNNGKPLYKKTIKYPILMIDIESRGQKQVEVAIFGFT